MERHNNWRLDTEARVAAWRAAETWFGRQTREELKHEEVPEAEDGDHTETHQEVPQATFELGELSSNPRYQARPTADECIDELYDRFSSWKMSYRDSQMSYRDLQMIHTALVTRFDTFEAWYQEDQE